MKRERLSIFYIHIKNFNSLYFSIFHSLLRPYINMTGRNLNIIKIGGFTSFSTRSRMLQGILRSMENPDSALNIFSLSWLWWKGPCTSITLSFEDRGLCFSYSRFEAWESQTIWGNLCFKGFQVFQLHGCATKSIPLSSNERTYEFLFSSSFLGDLIISHIVISLLLLPLRTFPISTNQVTFPL